MELLKIIIHEILNKKAREETSVQNSVMSRFIAWINDPKFGFNGFENYSKWNNYSCIAGLELINVLGDPYVIDSPEYKQKVNILYIHGLYNSKSAEIMQTSENLREFSKTLYEGNNLGYSTYEDFKNNTEKVEQANIKDACLQKWNNRLYVMNYDGSHHLVALYRQCYENRDEYSYFLDLNIKDKYIDCSQLETLLMNNYLLYTTACNAKYVSEWFRIYRSYPKGNAGFNLSVINGASARSILVIPKGYCISVELRNWLEDVNESKSFIFVNSTLEEYVRKESLGSSKADDSSHICC
ncbi:MAG: hypothetical protein ACI4P9_07075 [Selenomonadaceae bacterium]